ncbi:MAG: hypothetical protein ACYTJ0_17755 [Planctomycetota bacterium]|jgi:hypothetical protein
MVSKVRTLDRRLFTRRCVACGYDGALLQGGQARRCARCGCDLRERPARSYAEMEGLVGQPLTIDAPLRHQRSHERLAHKWFAFLFVTALMVLSVAYLLSTAFGL